MNHPKLSIIIPTFNRCATLARTLESLIEVNKEEGNFEVLIVDNGSSDGTSAMVEGFRSNLSRQQWRFLSEPMPGLLSARHRGALESAGDICIFIDDDVRLDPEWLNAFQDAFKDPSVVLVGGPSRPLFEVKPAPWLKAFQSVEEAESLYCHSSKRSRFSFHSPGMKEPAAADTLRSPDRRVKAHRTRRRNRVRIRHGGSVGSCRTTRDPFQVPQELSLLSRKKDSPEQHRNAKPPLAASGTIENRVLLELARQPNHLGLPALLEAVA